MVFTFPAWLDQEDRTPALPPTPHTAVPNWVPGDTIPPVAAVLRVIEIGSGSCLRTTTED